MEKWVTRTLALAGLTAAVACGGSSSPTAVASTSEDFATQLTGSNESPPVSTAATGTAAFVHAGDSVHFSINVSSLSGITGVSIYSGAAGVTPGTLRVKLFAPASATGTITGQVVTGTYRAADITGLSLSDQLSEMRTGAAFVNILTTANPSGTLRGQLGTADTSDPFFVLDRGAVGP